MSSLVKEQGIPYAGALVAAVSAWGINEWMTFFGIIFGAVTFLTGQYYQRRRDEREAGAREAAKKQEALEQEKTRLEQEKTRLEIAIGKARLTGLERRGNMQCAPEQAGDPA